MGLKTDKEYYVLFDYGELPGRSPTGTVCLLYYRDGKWYLRNSSVDRYKDGKDQDFNVDGGYDGNGKAKKAYYLPRTNPYYVIKVAGDLVTSDEWNNAAERAVMDRTYVRGRGIAQDEGVLSGKEH